MFVWLLVFSQCTTVHVVRTPIVKGDWIGGSHFYKKVSSCNWQQRDSIALSEIFAGNIPSFLKKFVRINTSIVTDKGIVHAHYFVMPDYMSVGTNNDWARVPLTPMTAQKIADSFHCFLPTRKIVNDVYAQAVVKLEPVPMYAFRDSSPTMWQHHLIIEGQRKGKKGLIAGIKKDVVISEKIKRSSKPDRVAIYGWHTVNGAIQPLYTGHVNWYVDYSHGVRLVYRTIWVDGKAMDYMDVLKHPQLQKILCDEVGCDCYRY